MSSLVDLFRRPRAARTGGDAELIRRVGRLEAEVERLDLTWSAYRDELKRLVNRLEKRDQRAAAREAAPCAEANGTGPTLDPVSARIAARRRHAIPHQLTG